jgi:DNA repair exonuclease SbcCD ATPase subunit
MQQNVIDLKRQDNSGLLAKPVQITGIVDLPKVGTRMEAFVRTPPLADLSDVWLPPSKITKTTMSSYQNAERACEQELVNEFLKTWTAMCRLLDSAHPLRQKWAKARGATERITNHIEALKVQKKLNQQAVVDLKVETRRRKKELDEQLRQAKRARMDATIALTTTAMPAGVSNTFTPHRVIENVHAEVKRIQKRWAESEDVDLQEEERIENELDKEIERVTILLSRVTLYRPSEAAKIEEIREKLEFYKFRLETDTNKYMRAHNEAMKTLNVLIKGYEESLPVEEKKKTTRMERLHYRRPHRPRRHHHSHSRRPLPQHRHSHSRRPLP